MRTDRSVTRMSSDQVAPIKNRQTPVKTLPSLAVGNYLKMRPRIAGGFVVPRIGKAGFLHQVKVK